MELRLNFDNKSPDAINLIKKVYAMDSRPWVIGYSGGKDSTTVTQLVFKALEEMKADNHKLNKKVYIISSDTLIENPMIIKYIDDSLDKLRDAAISKELPIEVHKIKPEIKDSFWVNMIGKGYPAPIQNFRWCTDRLKIKPANKFIMEKVDEFGEVIMLLGVRKGESASRDKVLKKHEVEGKILKAHTTLNNAYVFAPIENFTTDDVWEYLINNYKTPWGTNNNELLKLYEDSTESGECPLVVDKDTPSCGNSRFGCWICTVVKEDKSLQGFLRTARFNNDEKTIKLLEALLKLRNRVKLERDPEKGREHLYNFRERRRRNGTTYTNTKKLEDGTSKEMLGLGPYTLKYRQGILKELLEIERDQNYPLITREELVAIQQEWKMEYGDLSNGVNQIYDDVYGEGIDAQRDEQPYLSKEDSEKLKELCQEEGLDAEIIGKLLGLELEYYGYKYRSGIYESMDKIMGQDWIHDEKYQEEINSDSGEHNNDN